MQAYHEHRNSKRKFHAIAPYQGPPPRTAPTRIIDVKQPNAVERFGHRVAEGIRGKVHEYQEHRAYNQETRREGETLRREQRREGYYAGIKQRGFIEGKRQGLGQYAYSPAPRVRSAAPIRAAQRRIKAVSDQGFGSSQPRPLIGDNLLGLALGERARPQDRQIAKIEYRNGREVVYYKRRAPVKKRVGFDPFAF